MLKSIYIVTVLVLSVSEAEQAWNEDLGYRVVKRGAVSDQLGEAWGQPAVAGRPYVLMQPDSGEQVYLRFIETGGTGNYEPMKTLGWNAIEVHVKDPDGLVESLDPERFSIVGEPAFLTGTDNIRAAQVLGPHSELLYLTHVIDPAKSTFNIGTAQTPVDRVFIMVLGAGDVVRTANFYRNYLGVELSPPLDYRIRVLSRAWGMPESTLHPLSVVQLKDAFLIEVDQYPSQAPRRSMTSAGLPYGPAMVSFMVDDLSGVARKAGRVPVILLDPPYNGRAVLLLEGPSGELIELVAPAGGESTGR